MSEVQMQYVRKALKYVRPEHFLNTREACRKLKISRYTLHRWVKSGRIKPFIRVGKGESAAWLFIDDEVDAVRNTRYKRKHKSLMPTK